MTDIAHDHRWVPKADGIVQITQGNRRLYTATCECGERALFKKHPYADALVLVATSDQHSDVEAK